MSWSGYDIEDAIVMNKASLDRGFGRCIVYRKYGIPFKKYANRSADRIVAPTVENGKVIERHRVLDADGLTSVGEFIHPGGGGMVGGVVGWGCLGLSGAGWGGFRG